MEMRYSLALYCSDLTDSDEDFLPVGVLVVDEKAQRYAFRYLEIFSSILDEDAVTQAMWQSIPVIIERNFEEYCSNPNHHLYKGKGAEYHGFISQIIEEMAQSSISFSGSAPIEGSGDLEKTCISIFQKEVLQKLN